MLSRKRKILSPRSRHSLCLACVEPETRADSLSRVHLSLAHEVHLSLIAELFPLFRGKFSVILQIRSDLLRDFLEKICSSSPLIRIFFGFSI